MIDQGELRALWRRIPVDDVGYLDAADLLRYSDGELRATVERMAEVRYRGWRNHENRWRDVLGLDSTSGKTVLDYGCGIGLEALQYAQAGNRVVVADLHGAAVDLAWRVLDAYGHPAFGSAMILDSGAINPDFGDHAFDVIHMAGVLHHIPDPSPVLAHCQRWLKPQGELRLLLYSDQAWRQATSTDPPEHVEDHPAAGHYAQFMDMPGSYADWYDQDRLASRAGQWFRVKRCEYVGPDRTLLAATLTPRRNR